MAEYLMKDIAQKRGLSLNIASAGTSGWHDGESMHCGTSEILDGLNIPSSDFTSQKVPENAIETYDYIIVMDDHNLRDLQQRFGAHPNKIFKITDLLPENSPHQHVPDPWYTGDFNQTREILSQCCHILADKIAQQTM